ncbi:MAG: TSUP family transporter, partial [Phycisphaerales bacterium]
MPADAMPTLAILFLVVGALYASVGHAGASGYLAVMALVGVAPESMRSTTLAVNVVVATIAFGHYAAAGHFSWRFLLPFLIGSTPAAFLGGAIALPVEWLRLAIGAVLAWSAVRMAIVNLPAARTPQPPRDPSIAVKVSAGALLGFAAGLTGTGGGIVLSPLILLCGWAEPKRTA